MQGQKTNSPFKLFLSTNKNYLFTILFSTIVLFVFFGHLILNINSSYSEPGGDGLQSYYNCIYHAQYDQQYFRQTNMNYPFGEQVFFTACQPVLTGFIKLFGLVNYTVGIMNLVMLISILLCSLFIYLIFEAFQLKGIPYILVATAISFLSPQIIRMIYHHTLTFQFAIPCFIWLLIKLDQTKKIKYSIYISVLTFIMSSIHLYFFSFFIFIACFYYLYFITRTHEKIIKRIIHLFTMFLIQLIIPFLLIQVIIKCTDDVSDRTTQPWGFLVYKSNWDGVFYPYNKIEETVINKIISPPATPVAPEGIAYIGIFGIILSFIFARHVILNLFKLKKIPPFTHPLLNYLFLTSFVALFLSFAYPFSLGHEDWLDKVGAIKQIRSIGRFAWLFFYIVNIFGFIYICSLITSEKNKKIFALFAFLIIGFDAYQNIYKFENVLINKFPDLDDKTNSTENFKWVKQIDPKKYQCIIPLPYFHTGSENLFIQPKGEIKKWTFIASLKTGLPVLASSFSRTSLKQTANNIQIALEPLNPYKILSYCPNQKPFLIIVDKNAELNAPSKNILAHSNQIYSGKDISVFSIDYKTLADLSNLHFSEINNTYQKLLNENALTKFDNYYTTTNIKNFVINTFENSGIPNGYFSNSCINGKGKDYAIFYNDSLPFSVSENEYVVSIWVKDVQKDVIPRITFIVDLYNSKGVFYKSGAYASVKDFIKCLDGDWGMIECKFKLNSKNDIVKIGFLNDCIESGKEVYYDELMIRPVNTDIYKKINDNSIFKNNMVYKFTSGK